ncbi:MAG: hypothetical protein ABI977_33680 [Acidobacteriota bacterium]
MASSAFFNNARGNKPALLVRRLTGGDPVAFLGPQRSLPNDGCRRCTLQPGSRRFFESVSTGGIGRCLTNLGKYPVKADRDLVTLSALQTTQRPR